MPLCPDSRPSPARLLGLVAIASTTAACYLFNPNHDPPAQVEACHAEGVGGDKSKTREVALGDGHGKDFVPYEDGGTVALVTGGQGLSMVTPYVRVKAESGDPSEACFFVSVHSEAAGTGGAGGTGGSGGSGAGGDPNSEPLLVSQGAKMKLEDGYFYTDGVLYNPVEWSSVELTLTVAGKDFLGTSTVHVLAGGAPTR